GTATAGGSGTVNTIDSATPRTPLSHIPAFLPPRPLPIRGHPMKHRASKLLATALLLAAATAQAAPPPATLKQAYADAFLIGTAVNDRMVSGEDARAQALVPPHFNAITAENVMKVEVLHPEPGTWDFAAADAFVAFGQQHDMHLVG